MDRRLTAVTLVMGCSLSYVGTAFAQSLNPYVDGQTFRVAPGAYNFLTTEGARTDGHLGVSGSLFVNYAYHPVTIFNGTDCPTPGSDNGCTLSSVRSRPIVHLGTANLLGAITLFRRIQIGVDIPVHLESGDNTDAITGYPSLTMASQTGATLGDPRLEVKARLLGAQTSGPALGISVFGQAPIARYLAPDVYFVGDSSAQFGGRIIGEYRAGMLAVAANVGVVIRPEAIQVFTFQANDRLTYNAAASYDITPRIAGVVDVFGSMDLTSPGTLSQHNLEADAAARYHMGDVSFTLGGGAGVLRGLGTPVARAFLGVTYAPYRVDTDGDGILDDVDNCPNQPEDRDGFQDSDGCPDPDNDGDGLLDVNDHCPNDAEDRDGFLDSDGCPDRDNDNDGIADGFDSCPNVPEDHDGDRDDDGCPDNDRDRDGIPDERDQCPTEPEDTDGFQDEDGCPDPDNDQDGILDVNDQCSEQPETYNGYQDEDGCPDTIPDRDHDGIPDGADHCPDQPETYNGIEDEDGCPERGPNLIQIEGSQIRILQQVNFATNSDRIVGAGSFRVLDAVVAVLNARPQLGRIEVQGHTDNVGNADTNRDLSRRRAASVVTYLLAHGIDASRLTSRGVGPDQPLVENTNGRNRARNRRVEFHVLGRGTDANASPAPGAASVAPPSAAPVPATPPPTAPVSSPPPAAPSPAPTHAAPALDRQPPR